MINKFQKIYIIHFAIVLIYILLSSCNDIAVIKVVGTQFSDNENSSKKHRIFLCSYRPLNTTLEKHNKHYVNEVFCEYQYSHNGDFFFGYKRDFNESQIIIIDTNYNFVCHNDSCYNDFVGYERRGHLYYKFFNKVTQPDTIRIQIKYTDSISRKRETDELIYIRQG